MLRKVLSSLNQSSVSFQILSGLHLEIPACAEHLILAGDIGRLTDYEDYRNFLQKLTDRFKLVFLALGNYELYNGTFETGIERAKRLGQDPALTGRLIVHQKRYDVPDWSVDDHNARHAAGKRSRQRSLLVVTHHAPLLQGTSSPKHAQSPWSVAFATGVKVWVFGHTHYTTDFIEKGVRVVSNQRGNVLPWSYPKAQSGFDVRKPIMRISPIVIISSLTPLLDHISYRARAPYTTTTMTSRDSNPVSRLAEAAKEKVAPSTSKAKDPSANWTPEEMFETTLDRNGNPVPNDSYIDVENMRKGRQGPDEGDVFAAANEDFD
ncbi:hypothetical protein BO83DRAFT_410747 [Aspergillus eucalypticola CBS 122712]|uniref:Calcineurin-like phosphoesterase domain-containing protein n=1 Tax=Aspergillus eucalypticola (strain CBS 122712 / IBT 29274) TaxID=1448314 RepID=A0A317UWH1_ASPEC|nr:uncharacterized protein BO83DRAFT_410747 [Aspergillus eucalypticola CBS 122712]PWY65826.1 hypothetical protein BO83DRAFT_410747 [Aspergillus eucalypticola CBS 122712]